MDFCNLMILKDPIKRLSAASLLKHEWLISGNDSDKKLCFIDYDENKGSIFHKYHYQPVSKKVTESCSSLCVSKDDKQAIVDKYIINEVFSGSHD